MEPMHSPVYTPRDSFSEEGTGAGAPAPALLALRQRVAVIRREMGEPDPGHPTFHVVPDAAPDATFDPGPGRQMVTGEAPTLVADRLAGELVQLREWLAGLGGSSGSGLLAESVLGLSRKIDLLNAKALDPVAVRRLELQASELRATIERAVRLQEAAEARAAASALPLMEHAGALRESAAATLAGQHRVERDVVAMRERLHGMAARLEGLPEDVSGAIAHQIGDLLDRIDAAGSNTAALAPLVEVIERHLVLLTRNVMASQARLDRLDGIEAALLRLGERMDDMHYASTTANIEAMQSVALRLSVRDDAPAVLGLKRGLAALEARQRAFEMRAEDMLAREVEIELEGLATLGSAQRFEARRGMADMPSIDLDRRIFAGALGDDHLVEGRQARADWLAAADRAEVREEEAPSHRRRLVRLAARAAVLIAAVGLAGVTILQIARPGASFARTTPDGVAVATSVSARVPVQAPELASLAVPAGLPPALKEAAQSGDPAAAYEVGVRLADGRGTAADSAAAMKWLAYAAARGSAPAAYRLGTLYEQTARNGTDAGRLYAWAAERGNVRAMHSLGVLATEGKDGKGDWEGALRWFRKAAELGFLDSQHNLGVIYARGLAGQADPVEAYKWFTLAAAQGDTSSARKRDELARRMDEAAIGRGRAAAAALSIGTPDKDANLGPSRPEWDTPGAATPVASLSPDPTEASRVAALAGAGPAAAAPPASIVPAAGPPAASAAAPAPVARAPAGPRG